MPPIDYDFNRTFMIDITLRDPVEDSSWCTCGLCSSLWKLQGWGCDRAELAYLASGRALTLGAGCRQRIATDRNVPPGFIGRRGMSLHIGPYSGIGRIPPEVVSLNCIYRYKALVPVLPLEYYSGLILDLMWRDLYIGADGSAFAVRFGQVRPKVFHLHEMTVGTALRLHCTYRIVFNSGYRSLSFVLTVAVGGDVSLWLSHEVLSMKPFSRCCSAVTHLQRRLRRWRAARQAAS